MYIVIMGGGRVGFNLANLLVNDGHDITLIENSEVLCNHASIELDALIICGNGADTKTLEEANIEDADFFVAATESDEMNLLSSILVKNYGPKIITRVSNPNYVDDFKRVGIDDVISPEMNAAIFLKTIITQPDISDLAAFGKEDAEIVDITVENEKVIGKKISEIPPTNNHMIIATYNKGKLEIPKPDTVLNKGDKISILIKRGSFQKTMKKFVK